MRPLRFRTGWSAVSLDGQCGGPSVVLEVAHETEYKVLARLQFIRAVCANFLRLKGSRTTAVAAGVGAADSGELQPEALPKSPLDAAIGYALRNWVVLTPYAEVGSRSTTMELSRRCLQLFQQGLGILQSAVSKPSVNQL